MSKNKKTNAMRILDTQGKVYNVLVYDKEDGCNDGVSVAKKIDRDAKYVYKTLVTQGNSKKIFVFVIPVEKELDFKKAAKAVGEKSIELIPVKDIIKRTGYIKGGCSPIGMKKTYKTIINETALNIEKIIVSGGKIGMQIEINVEQLKEMINAKHADVIK